MLYSVTGQGGSVQAWDMATLTWQESHSFGVSHSLEPPWSLLAVQSDGGTQLLAAGGQTLNGVRLAANGEIAAGLGLSVSGEGGTQGLTALTMLQSGGREFLIGAGRQHEGLKIWQQTGDSRFAAVEQSLTLGLVPGDVPALADVGDGTVLALSTAGNRLMRIQVGADGQMSVLGQIDVRDGFWVKSPTHVQVVETAGQSYALVGAQGASSVSVVALGADGGMVVTDHVIDERDTRFSGLSVLETVAVGDQVFVVAGGMDDGLTVMTLLPGGRLLHLQSISDDNVMALTDPSALALAAGETGFGIAVAGRMPHPEAETSGLGLTWLEVELGSEVTPQQGQAGDDQPTGGSGSDRPADNDTLSAEAGDHILIDSAGRDVLTGGAGRDIFVLLADGERDVITGFQLGEDRLDLSQMGRFYSVEALDIRARSWGAEIHVGDEVTEVRSADGQRLTAADFSVFDLRDLSHLPVEPLDLGDQNIVGSAASNFLEGGTGDDTLTGGAGADMLVGNAGNDWLTGGRVDAEFDPVAGQIFRLYQATLDRAPDMSGLFGWADLLIENRLDLTGAAEGFVQSREFGRIYGALDAEDFVTLLYHNVLERAPDAAGLAGWTAWLDSGAMSRAAVVVGFSESAEFRAATAIDVLQVSQAALQASWSEDVFRLYQATLDRVPDPGGFTFWTGQLGQGMPLGTVVSGFTGSAEFLRTYDVTEDSAFVTLLYENVLGRAPDAAGLAGWTDGLGSGALSREDVVMGFAASPEFKRAMAEPMIDWIRAQGIDDHLDGGEGVNVLQGGMMSDRFVFHADTPASHTVVDPEAWDVLVFEGFGYDDAADVRDHLAVRGDDLVFFDQQVSVTLRGLTLDDFDPGMFASG